MREKGIFFATDHSIISRPQLGTPEQVLPYSKKLIGRLRNVGDSAQLQLIGGRFDGEKVKARHLMPFLPLMPLSVDAGLQEVAAFNVALPKATEAMLGVGGSTLREERYIQGIGGEDFQNILPCAVRATLEGAKQSSIAIRLVYGATEEMPLRALSYFLPALVYMGNMQRAGIGSPQLQVIFANNIACGLNHLNYESAARQSKKFTVVAQDYIMEFFPGLVESVVFLEDTPLYKGSALRDELLQAARVVREVAPSEVKEDLLRKGNNGGGRRINIFYGAAHVLMHDIDLPGSLIPITPDQPAMARPKVIISFGGKQEQLFYRLRHVIKPYLGLSYQAIPTLQFFTRHHVPAYYMSRDGDYSLDDALVGKSCDDKVLATAARYDLNYLYTVSSRRSDFTNFLDTQRRKR